MTGGEVFIMNIGYAHLRQLPSTHQFSVNGVSRFHEVKTVFC